jgi:TfoX/Sxy family transcriptional regulator of competence genes
VAYDESLARRVRELLGHTAGLTEARMFGGLAFLVGGNMAVAVSRGGGLLVRVDPAQVDSLLEGTSARPMEMRGRAVRGWLRVDATEVDATRELARWVELGAAYAGTLQARPAVEQPRPPVKP